MQYNDNNSYHNDNNNCYTLLKALISALKPELFRKQVIASKTIYSTKHHKQAYACWKSSLP